MYQILILRLRNNTIWVQMHLNLNCINLNKYCEEKYNEHTDQCVRKAVILCCAKFTHGDKDLQ